MFIADDLADWLIGIVADAGRKRLVAWVLGDEQERALRRAVREALRLTDEALSRDGSVEGDLTIVVGEVFSAEMPSPNPRGQGTVLEGLQAGIAAQLAPLDDPDITGTGQSSAELLGVSAGVIAEELTDKLVQQILADGLRGGPLGPLASQLNDDATHLQGGRLEQMLERLTSLVLQEMSPLRRPVNRPLSHPGSPFALGIHRAVDGPPGSGTSPALSRYVARPHDEKLRQLVMEAGEASRLIVAVGDSSTGKTRALWEAVQALPAGWRLWQPADPRDLHDGLTSSAVGMQTVVWLDDAHEYLDPRHTRLAVAIAEALTSLLADADRQPVLVAATMWPDIWAALTAPARKVGGRDEAEGSHDIVTDLLTMAEWVSVPDAFVGAALTSMREAAKQDARLAHALQNSHDGRVTQYLAGALKQQERYETATPEARALIDVAMDACRLGHRNELPAALLLSAAPGYIHQETWDRLDDDWGARALQAVSARWRGLDGPLTLIRPRSADGAINSPCYRLADALEQAGRRDRRFTAPPQSFWDAATKNGCLNDLYGIGHEAEVRGRARNAMLLYSKASRAGDPAAHAALAWMREWAGDHDEADRLALKAAAKGELWPVLSLAELSKSRRDYRRAGRMYQVAVNAGNYSSMAELEEVLDLSGGAPIATSAWHAGAHAGSQLAFARLAVIYEDSGDHEAALRSALQADSFLTISDIARQWEAKGDLDHAKQLVCAAAASDIRLPSHGEWLDSKVAVSLKWLADFSERTGAAEEADFYALAADDAAQAWEIARGWDLDGRRASAERLALAAAQERTTVSGLVGIMGGGADSILGLAGLCDRAGRPEAAHELALASVGTQAAMSIACKREEEGHQDLADLLATDAARIGHTSIMVKVIEMRQAARDWSAAEHLYHAAAQIGDPFVAQELAMLRERSGRPQEAEELAVKATRSGNFHALTYLAQMREHKNSGEAKRLYAMAADAGDTGAFVWLARLHEREGDFRRAEQYWGSAAERNDPNALEVLAERHERAGLTFEAENLAMKAAEAGSADALIRIAAARAQAGENGKMAQLALHAARSDAVTKKRDFVHSLISGMLSIRVTDAMLVLAEHLLKEGDHDGVRDFIRELAGIDFEYIAAMLERAESRREKGQVKEAEEMFQVMADLNIAAALGGLARIREGRSEYSSAERLWFAAIEAGYKKKDSRPGDSSVYDGLDEIASMYKRSGDGDSLERICIIIANVGWHSSALMGRYELYEDSEAAYEKMFRYGLSADGSISAPWRFEELEVC